MSALYVDLVHLSNKRGSNLFWGVVFAYGVQLTRVVESLFGSPTQ